MNTTKTLRFGIALLLILATLSHLFIFASADNDYSIYRSKVKSIDNSRLRNTEQLHALYKNGLKRFGMCNLCSMETLLNRRVAYDFGDYSSPFEDRNMFDAVGVKDQGDGKKKNKDGQLGYYLGDDKKLSDKIGLAQRDGTKYPYPNNSSVTYQPVLLGNAAVTKLIKPYGDGLNAQYQAIAELLREHPEGIFLRAQYRTHAIVITDYTENNGEIQLFAIDPVNVRDNGWGRMPIEKLYFHWKNYKDGMISDIDPKTGNYRINIAYLVQTAGSPATHPAAPTYDAPASAPVISISGQNLPDSQTVGDNFGIRGTVYTDCGTITYLRGSIMDEAGNEVQLGQYYPAASSVDLRYTLNNDLVFGYLPAGQYTYCVMATAQNGGEETTQELIRQSFTVGSPDMPETPTYDAPASAPVISISGQNLPEYQTVGDNFGIRGTVYTDCGTITYLRGSIMDSAGNEVQVGRYYPSASSVDLRYTLNNDLVFGYLPAGQYTYSVMATAKNGSEETTLELIRQSFTVGSPDMPETPTYDAPASAPVISISGQNLPEYQTVGDNFGIRGTVYTDCGTITYLRGSIMDSAGNEVQLGQYYPSASSVDLRYTLNNDLIFGYLPAGQYTYSVMATAKNGSEETTQELIHQSFTVASPDMPETPTYDAPASAPVISISGQNLPEYQTIGDNFGIRGTVYTDCGTITYLHGSIVDSAGNIVQVGQYYPSASSVDLRYTLNNDLIFGYLPAGQYTYYVTATAQNGSEQTTQELICQNFTVAYPDMPETMPETPTYDAPASAPVISINGQNLPEYQTVGKNFGIRGTVYTDCGTITYLRGSIMDSAGNEVQLGQYYPSASSVDLRYTLNNDLIFGYLPAGVYTYYVQAKAENNGQETVTTLIEHVFTVEGAGESTQAEPELNPIGYNMTVNVGAGSTLRFCSTVSIADQYELGSLPNGAVVYVYGTTQQQYEDRTWAKISYNGADGWVNYKWLY